MNLESIIQLDIFIFVERMSLNWNFEVILDLALGSILLLGSVTFIINSRKTKVKPLFYFGLSWFFYSLFFYFEMISYLFLDLFFAKLQALMTIPSLIFLVLYIDYTRKESFNVLNISIATGFSFLEFYLIFFAEGILIMQIDGGWYTMWIDGFFVISTIMQAFFIYFLTFWMITSAINAPKEIKYVRNYFIIGILLLAPIALFLFVLSSLERFYIIIADISMGIGAIITVYVLINEPKIFHILPFTAYQLNVVHIPSGLPLFEYRWANLPIREDHITASLHGLRNISLNILNMGEIKDINLERAVLITQKSLNVYVGLLTSNGSRMLRDCLKNFTSLFEEQFKEQLTRSVKDYGSFSKANELIQEVFAYVPSRLS